MTTNSLGHPYAERSPRHESIKHNEHWIYLEYTQQEPFTEPLYSEFFVSSLVNTVSSLLVRQASSIVSPLLKPPYVDSQDTCHEPGKTISIDRLKPAHIDTPHLSHLKLPLPNSTPTQVCSPILHPSQQHLSPLQSPVPDVMFTGPNYF